MENNAQQTSSLDEIFGKPIYTYSRMQALADGFQVKAPANVVREAGFTVPVFINRTVWDLYVEVPAKADGQDLDGRLWDVLYMLGQAIRRSSGSALNFSLYVRNDNRRPKLVTLKAEMGPQDIDDPAPALTVMLTTED